MWKYHSKFSVGVSSTRVNMGSYLELYDLLSLTIYIVIFFVLLHMNVALSLSLSLSVSLQ